MDFKRHSLKSKFRSSSCFSCCFSASDGGGDGDQPPSLLRSSSTWIRAKAQGIPNAVNRHRRQGSGGFRYDPLSYALNFDEGPDDDSFADEDLRYGNFSSRLPVTPPPASPPRAAAAVRVACS